MRIDDAGPQESDQLAHFEAEAHTWWDFEGPARWSHRYLPVQLQFIREALGRASGGTCNENDVDLVAAGCMFDAVVSTEVLEHVPDPLFVRQCAALVAPGGVLVLSTINRTVKSYIYAILFGQYVFRLLSPRTHQWQRFVTPQEIADSMLTSGLIVQSMTGVTFDTFRGCMRRSADTSVNFMIGGVARGR